jgi:hypothetical protein
VVEVPYEADRRDDADVRPFTLTAAAASGALVLDPVGAGELRDDDGAPHLVVTDATGTEGEPFLLFSARLSAPSDQVVFAAGLATSGTARHREDFGSEWDGDEGTFVAGEIEPGAVEGVLRLALVDDHAAEPAETLRLVLRDVIGATWDGDAALRGVIVDDDAAPTQ